MDLRGINHTILRYQPTQLDERAADEALAAAASGSSESLEARRLAAACALSDRWPMAVCMEIARALVPGPTRPS